MTKATNNTGKRAYRGGSLKEYGTVTDLVGNINLGGVEDGGGPTYSS